MKKTKFDTIYKDKDGKIQYAIIACNTPEEVTAELKNNYAAVEIISIRTIDYIV